MPRLILILCITVALAGGASAQPGKAASAGGWLKAGDVVIEDFEDDFKISPASATADPAHWQSTGDAFTGVHSADSRFATGAGVAEGYAWACGEKVIYSSRGWGHRTLSGAATGTLTSPAFTVEKGYLSFLIGGAQNLQALAVQLVHKGRVVRAATGTGHIALRMVAFDLRELKGEQVQIRLVDQLRGADAVLIADRFVQTDEPPTSEVIAQPPPQTPWVVHTRKGMLHGEVVLQGEQLTVGGEVVAPQTVLSLTNPNVGGRQVTLSGVRLRNGELWSGEVRGYRNGIVQIEGVFGVRDLELSEVSSLIFDGSIPVHAQAPDTLHLIERDPLPGKLVWVKDKDIAVDCALGILPVPRPQIAQFVVEAVSNKAADPDLIQIGLTDGSILYSKALQITDGMLQIKHPVLGDFGLGLDRIASLRRSPEDAFWLAEPSRVEAQGLIGAGVYPELRENGQAKGQAFQRALRLSAMTTAAYELPDAMQQGATLRGALVPQPQSRADAQVMFRVDGKTIWQTKVAADSDPVKINVKLPAGEILSITVAYDGTVAVPCGVDWLDAHLLSVRGDAK